MSEGRNKPSVALLCTAVLVVALLAYPLSFGPACWTTSQLNIGADAVSVMYRPITWAIFRSAVIAAVLVPYSELLAAPDWHWVLINESDSKWMAFSIGRGMPIDPDDLDAPVPAK